MQEFIDSLNSNPIFLLSQSSNELYHSNMMYFLLRNFPTHFTKVFGSYDQNQVFREKKFGTKSVDLAIKEDNQIKILIEVKIKDILTQKQADQYDSQNLIKNKYCLSFFENPKVINWTNLKFSKLLPLLKDIIIRNSDNSNLKNELAIISLYQKMLEDLYKITDNLKVTYNYKDLLIEKPKSLEEIKFSVAWKRHFGHIFINKVTSEFKHKHVSINNKQATLTFETEINAVRIGIQIEGFQYRRFVEINKQNSDIIESLFSKSWLTKEWLSPKGKTLCQYDHKNKIFYYQYNKFNDDFTAERLSELLSKDAKDARAVLNELFPEMQK